MKFTKTISFLLVAILAIGVLASCGSHAATDADTLSYVSLRINPEIELITDANGNVVLANAVNEDGEVVLSVIELEGKSVEEASALFTQSANELGFVTGEKDTVYIGVESADEDVAAELTEKLNKSVRDYFNNNGINGKVSAETLDKYADRAAEWGISAGHTKLVMRALDANPELTDEEVLKLSHKELMQLLKGNKDEERIAAGLREEYHTAVQALKGEYAELFALNAKIDSMEVQLDGELSDGEKDAIKAQIAELDAQRKPLQSEYKKELDALKSDFRAASKELRREYSAQAQKRRNERKSNTTA